MQRSIFTSSTRVIAVIAIAFSLLLVLGAITSGSISPSAALAQGELPSPVPTTISSVPPNFSGMTSIGPTDPGGRVPPRWIAIPSQNTDVPYETTCPNVPGGSPVYVPFQANPIDYNPDPPGTVYDLLHFIAHPAGSGYPVRSRSACASPQGEPACAPETLKQPIYVGGGGYNAYGVHRYTNMFYFLKKFDGPQWQGSGGYISFEKWSYDDRRVTLERDGSWADGTPPANGFRGQPFDQAASVPDVSGFNRSGRFNVPAGYSPDVPNRFMTFGQYLDAPGFPNHNIPSRVVGFQRYTSDGGWSNVPAANFYGSETIQLFAHGKNSNWGSGVPSGEWITIRKLVDATYDATSQHGECYPVNGCPFNEERYTYQRGVGLVRFEHYSTDKDAYNRKTGKEVCVVNDITWGNIGSDFGNAWDIPTDNPSILPMDPANDHFFINMASQMSNKHLQVFFATNTEPSFSEEKSTSLEINNDGGWYTYELNFAANSRWKGTITNLRFDPTDGTGSWGNGTTGWQRIRIGTETKSTPGWALGYTIGFDGDRQGFSTYNMGWSWIQSPFRWILTPQGSDPQVYRGNVNMQTGR